ncbi:MAG: hypothetical protein OEY14_10930 [Myxococcales bacterium]|nr:hypothetical protein [Myxococcales bacterium]
MSVHRVALPLLLTFGLGVFFALEIFSPEPAVRELAALLQEWAMVIVSGAFVLGAWEVLRRAWRRLRRGEPGASNQVVLIVSATLTIAIGIAGGRDGAGLRLVYASILAPASAAIFSLLAFFIASAAYRALRLRGAQTGLMLGVAAIVIVGLAPFGASIPGASALAEWILDYPHAAGRRAILMGAAIGGALLAARVILGRERDHLGRS